MNELDFPALTIAIKRLKLAEGGLLAEAVLHAIGCGWSEPEAVKTVVTEELYRRGTYRGRLKRAVDSGIIFSPTEDRIQERRRRRRMGRFQEKVEKAISKPVAERRWAGDT
ncbi:MAG: hypothetical protein FWG74_07715 [Planctomycetes bacterium]|nr:hypothetical protein [Planctomycetota bacterium]